MISNMAIRSIADWWFITTTAADGQDSNSEPSISKVMGTWWKYNRTVAINPGPDFNNLLPSCE